MNDIWDEFGDEADAESPNMDDVFVYGMPGKAYLPESNKYLEGAQRAIYNTSPYHLKIYGTLHEKEVLPPTWKGIYRRKYDCEQDKMFWEEISREKIADDIKLCRTCKQFVFGGRFGNGWCGRYLKHIDGDIPCEKWQPDIYEKSNQENPSSSKSLTTIINDTIKKWNDENPITPPITVRLDVWQTPHKVNINSIIWKQPNNLELLTNMIHDIVEKWNAENPHNTIEPMEITLDIWPSGHIYADIKVDRE